jgi:hypothetical protein
MSHDLRAGVWPEHLLIRSAGVSFPDETDPPRGWEALCSHFEKQPSPFITRIFVVPTTRATIQLRKQVQEYARRQPFFTVVEDRLESVFAVTNIDGSNEITATLAGTLGGFLRDASGKVWGITCGHVAQRLNGSTNLDDVGGVQYVNAGVVGYSSFPSLVPLSARAVCNQYVGSPHSEVDSALIDLSSSFAGRDTVKALGSIDEIYDRTQLQSGSTVWMTGPKSGTQSGAHILA